MRYPNSKMISTYTGHTEGTHHRCEVLLRDDSIVVEYMEGNARVTYHGHQTAEGLYAVQQDSDGYRYSATLRRTDEDLLEGEWQTTRAGALYSSGTWSIELG
ncbi:hypothetical protein ACIUZJ_03055 [Pseudomonas aeruginosa]|nr:hypothetical protein [Pseudomonas aeruginosa]